MRKYIIMIVVGIGLAVSLPACGSSEPKDCIVLANGGNKLCGDEARAWCDSTDAIRHAGQDYTDGDSSTTELSAAVDESQSICDRIRGE